MIKNFDELLQKVKNMPNKTVVIAAAQTGTAIEAAVMAKKENLGNCIMTGDADYIQKYLNDNHPEFKDSFEIHDTGKEFVPAAKKAVELIRTGKGDLILKGKCDTATLLKAVLDKENGLRTGNIMSDVLAYETSDKILLMGDGGFLPLPDLTEKISIVKNCVAVAHKLGNENPKVALLTHSEAINPKVQSTIDAAVITMMNKRNQIKGCIIDGPLAFDNAINKNAAKLKGIKSEVAGEADILIVPNIEAGNIFGKSLTYYSHYRVAHVVMGAKVPILIASRADNAETKFLSMALGIMSS
ncbi:MAG: phosphate acetyltransferase [Candidatus Cloacimonadota bacterium]|nr:MAG: phosphate acetyltransferase [Candidatus Cloacimonadota bacterium]